MISSALELREKPLFFFTKSASGENSAENRNKCTTTGYLSIHRKYVCGSTQKAKYIWVLI